MRFKKQLISEEIGLNKTNKKTFTKGKSQKIVMSEGQLQRLMVSLKEVDELGEGAYCPGGCGGCECRHHGKFGKCDCGGPVTPWDHDKVAPGEGGDDLGPTNPQARFKGLCQNEQDCVDMNSSGCSAKGMGDVGTCSGSKSYGTHNSQREMEEGVNPACPNPVSCKPGHSQAPATHPKYPCKCVRTSSLEESRRVKESNIWPSGPGSGDPSVPGPVIPLNPNADQGKRGSVGGKKDTYKTKASNNNSNSGSGILPQCCYRPDGTIMAQNCNNCPTRPGFYCANCPPPVSESSSEIEEKIVGGGYGCGCRCSMCGGTYRALVCGGTGCYSLMSFAGKDGKMVKPNTDGSNVPDELKYKGEEKLEGKELDNWLDNAKRGYESKHSKVSLEEMRKLRTTQPINEAQVDKMSGWFNRLNKTGTHYNPVNLLEEDDEKYVSLEEDNTTWTCKDGKCVKVCGKCGVGEYQTEQECEDSNCEERARPTGDSKNKPDAVAERMTTSSDHVVSELKYTYNLIRKAIIKENIRGLNIKNYRGSLLTEQGMYDRNPGVAAAEGIENIIDNLKKGWAMIKDSTTRKQIQNTLTKLNNFMTYSAELIGSGSSQRAPRSYDQLANPLPFPELDEPEDLEDIDDGLEDFDEDWRNEEGKRYHNKNNR